MKDPLQQRETPYEVLRVERGASQAEINQAFKLRLAEGAGVRAITTANQALHDPQERALVDILHYDSNVLASLVPNPLSDPSVLLPDERASTAAAWEGGLKARFPDVGIAHALAVLWYWWAVYEEEHSSETMAGQRHEADGDGASSAPDVDQLWQRVTPYWVMLIATKEFWVKSQQVPQALAPVLQAKLADELRNHFRDLAQRSRGAGNGALAVRCQELELGLSTELRTARTMAAVGLSTGFGQVCCGPLLLQHLGLFETVNRQIDAALQKGPATAKLRELRRNLSPYSSVEVLIDESRPQEALDRIGALPQEQADSDEVSELRARALDELAKQQEGLGEIDKALNSWAGALDEARAESTVEAMKAEIVSACQSHAAKLEQHQPDKAISILETGLKLVNDQNLQLALAEVLARRGIKTFRDAQDKAGRGNKGVTTATKTAFKRGLADLERAAALGSQHAAEQLETARSEMERAEVEVLLREANKAAGDEDWDTAVSKLRKVLQVAASDAQDTLKKNLAVCLTNRAVQNVNRAMEMYNADTAAQQRELLQRMEEFRSGTDDELLRRVLSSLSTPAAEANRLLSSAEQDLAEASKLDPASANIKQTLKQVRELMAKVGEGSGAGLALGTGARPASVKIGSGRSLNGVGRLVSEALAMVGAFVGSWYGILLLTFLVAPGIWQLGSWWRIPAVAVGAAPFVLWGLVWLVGQVDDVMKKYPPRPRRW